MKCTIGFQDDAKQLACSRDNELEANTAMAAMLQLRDISMEADVSKYLEADQESFKLCLALDKIVLLLLPITIS